MPCHLTFIVLTSQLLPRNQTANRSKEVGVQAFIVKIVTQKIRRKLEESIARAEGIVTKATNIL